MSQVIRVVREFDNQGEQRDLHCCEFFAGVGNLAAAFSGAVMFEISYTGVCVCMHSLLRTHMHTYTYVFSNTQGGGLLSETFDIRRSVEDDLLTRAGFFRALRLGLRIRECGLAMWAPPCSWFIWLSTPMHRCPYVIAAAAP
jgi:hypothetical protein